MKHGSLFSGIGGFDLAAEWMGWENVFHCEWNPFGQKVLKHYWPNTISYNDITTTDFTIHRGSIDILTGGFPCQPYSNAGKRLGKEDERHLWPEMLRAIREIQPRYVVGENVRGLTNWNGGVVFDEVQSDLETQGYEVLPFLLPACAVNAPHRRDRIWFVAHLTNTGSEQFQKWPPKSISQDRKKNKSGVDNRAERSGNTRNAANANEQRPQTGAELQVSGNPEQFAGIDHESRTSGKQELRSQTKARIHGRSSDEHGFGWNNFPTQPPICSGDDGIPRNMDGITFPKYRQESIKAYGNAIVPQVALQIFKAIQETK